MKDFIVMSSVILMYVAAFIFYIIPSIVAWKRQHYYKWVIIALNLFFGTTGIGWLVALVWAAWPSNTPFFSLLTRDAVTGKSNTENFKEIGHAASSASKGTDQHTDKLELLERYGRLRNENVITEEELIAKKKELLG
jgi:hypothetical protein